jgi:fructose-bisphosphate aldolase, class II
MQQLRDVLNRAEVDRVAIGHFNVADLVLLKAVFDSARDWNVPVVVGASEGERKFFGLRQLAATVRSLREEFDFPIYLNADHTHSLSEAVEAARAGFDMVVFDASALPFEQNVRSTREAVEALKRVNPAILVEGELGEIGVGSEIHQQAPDLSKGLTDPAQAKEFVAATAAQVRCRPRCRQGAGPLGFGTSPSPTGPSSGGGTPGIHGPHRLDSVLIE